MKRILYIDYSAKASEVIVSTLRNEGFDVQYQDNYPSAIEFLKNYDATPNIILCAESINGEDGINFLRQIKTEKIPGHNIPIIFLSDSPNQEGHLQILVAGAIDIIHKPIEINYMIAKLRSQLRVSNKY